MDYIIRKEAPADYYDAELMTKKAFWNLHRPGCDEHLLVHKLRRDGSYVSELTRVAEKYGKIIGAIYYARARIESADGQSQEVLTFGPLCVDPEYQRQGIGGHLLEETLADAGALGFDGVVIFGEPDYYPRHGFVTCDNFSITTPEGENFSAFMARELCEGGLCGGKFYEPAVYYDLPEKELEEFERGFPYMEKKVLPNQWQQ